MTDELIKEAIFKIIKPTCVDFLQHNANCSCKNEHTCHRVYRILQAISANYISKEAAREAAERAAEKTWHRWINEYIKTGNNPTKDELIQIILSELGVTGK
jgi:hypothetical protein